MTVIRESKAALKPLRHFFEVGVFLMWLYSLFTVKLFQQGQKTSSFRMLKQSNVYLKQHFRTCAKF